MAKNINNISESEVEEALVANLTYLKNILKLDQEIRLVARQLKLKSGEQRIDLLLAHSSELCLVELKITHFLGTHIKQVVDYREELQKLQESKKLMMGNIKSYLLVTSASQKDVVLCKSNDIELIIYDTAEVLKSYFDKLATVAPFLKIKPNDYGVFTLGLINRVLTELSNKGDITKHELATITGLSVSSVHHHLQSAEEFGLIRKKSHKYFLTDLGYNYLDNGVEGILSATLSPEQSRILRDFIAKDPFYSSSVFGIYSIVESAFVLSRNTYPIEFKELLKLFVTLSGKVSEWQASRSQRTATRTFLNFAIQLGLLGKIGTQVVITPAGFRFILMLQLHKSIEMVESLL